MAHCVSNFQSSLPSSSSCAMSGSRKTMSPKNAVFSRTVDNARKQKYKLQQKNKMFNFRNCRVTVTQLVNDTNSTLPVTVTRKLRFMEWTCIKLCEIWFWWLNTRTKDITCKTNGGHQHGTGSVHSCMYRRLKIRCRY